MNIAQKNESYIQTLKPTVWIGKNGCTDEIVKEIKNQLKSRRIIKIKWLQNSDMDCRELKELAEHLNADVIDERGRSVVLGARNRGRSQQR